MKVTITATAQVPYTDVEVSDSIVLDSNVIESYTDEGRLFKHTYRMLEQSVMKQVDGELGKRGIQLGPEGMRLT